MTENHNELVQEADIKNCGNVIHIEPFSNDVKKSNISTCANETNNETYEHEELKEKSPKRSNVNFEEESSPFQERWKKFDTFLKKFYRTILDGKKPLDEYDNYVNIVKELVTNDPHQLFARLEVDLQEFIIELKLRQLELLDCVRTDEGPHLFIFCLIEGYNKLMFAAYTLSPLLLQLEVEHLARFNISWRSLNQHLFHTWVFTDPKIHKVTPLCISKLGKDNSEMSDFNKRLIRQFLTFDDEMTKVGGKWRETESAIIKYHQENTMLDAKWRMTRVNWDLIRNQTKIFHEQLKSSDRISTCIEGEILNGHLDSSFPEDALETLSELGKKPILRNASLQIKSLSDSFKKMKIDLETLQDQQLCECCQTVANQSLYSTENLDTELNDDEHSGKTILRSSCNVTCKDPDILAYLSADGKKMYSHLHKFKVQEMANGTTKIQRSTSINISVKEMKEMLNENDIELANGDLPDDQGDNEKQSASSSELHKTLLRKQVITQQRQQHQKKLMQMVQCSQQKDIQHKIQKQLQEHQLLLQQQRKIDELHAHLLQQHPGNSEDAQKSVHLQVQHRLIQKHKQVEEKFQQQVQQYIQQHQEKPNGPAATSCSHPKIPPPSTKTSNISNGASSPPITTLSTASATTITTPNSISSSIAKSQDKSRSVSGSPISNPVTHKNTTTQTTSSSANGQNRPQTHSLSDVAKSANYVCPKHGDNIKQNGAPYNNNADHSYSSEYSSEDEFDWERTNSPQRHCDCCYCEVFGSAPVSRNFQETRERLRLILTKKKAKSNANSSETPNEQAGHGPENKLDKEGRANDKKPIEVLDYKGDKSIDEIMDFIEGNKPSNLKRTAKKMRRRQRQLEEEERRRKEEEAERLRQEELRRKEEEEKRRLEEEKRKQELLRKKGLKKSKKEAKQQKQLAVTKQAAPSNQTTSSKKSRNEKNPTNVPNNAKLTHNKNGAQKQLQIGNKNAQLSSKTSQPTRKDVQKQAQSQQLSRLADKQNSDKKKGNQVPASYRSQKKSQQTNKILNNEEPDSNSDQPQMVTIKRVLQPNCNEPTVTITLRGATPKEDKVLYTLQNGQMCPLKAEAQKKQNVVSNTSDANSGKKNRIINVNSVINRSGIPPPVHSMSQLNTYSFPSSNSSYNSPSPASSKNFNFTKSNTTVNKGVSNMTHKMEKINITPVPNPLEAGRKFTSTNSSTQPELTTPTAIQINQAVNQLSSRPSFPNNFDLENIKLPPGITITKVDPNTVQRKPIQVKQQQQPPPPPPPPPVSRVQMCQNVIPPVPCSSNVIVVDTNDRNESPNSKKKRRRRKNKDGTEMNFDTNHTDHSSLPAFVNSNGLGPHQRLNSGGLYGNPFMNSGYGTGSQQSAAIIQMNGSMVTIRNPALHHAYSAHPPMSIDQGNVDMRNPVINGACDEVENGDADEYEQELEAFKQFCSQSVPAESKAKVNLNIEDIVLKKKGPVIGCS